MIGPHAPLTMDGYRKTCCQPLRGDKIVGVPTFLVGTLWATITPGEFRHGVGELALGEPIDALRLRLFSEVIGMMSQSAPKRCSPLGSHASRSDRGLCGTPADNLLEDIPEIRCRRR
jgi:hypothetical protein